MRKYVYQDKVKARQHKTRQDRMKQDAAVLTKPSQTKYCTTHLEPREKIESQTGLTGQHPLMPVSMPTTTPTPTATVERSTTSKKTRKNRGGTGGNRRGVRNVVV